MDDNLVPDNVSSASVEGWVWKVKATREGVMARKVEQRWAICAAPSCSTTRMRPSRC